VLGDFRLAGDSKVMVAVEGKGPKDPLDRPFAGRPMSAIDQAYRYAINLPCDWIVVTSIRQTRLYYKGSDQQTYEAFDTVQLAAAIETGVGARLTICVKWPPTTPTPCPPQNLVASVFRGSLLFQPTDNLESKRRPVYR
jgi:hypothetical protein